MKTTLLLLTLFIAINGQAQNVKKAIVKIDTAIKGESLEIPYAAIKVLDARFDQSKIGCIYNSLTPFGLSTYKYDAVFPESLESYLPKFLSTFIKLDNESKDSLFILVKNFRIADNFIYDVDEEFQIKLTLNISASFYCIHNGKYFRLFPVNDVLQDDVYYIHEKKKIKHNEGTRAISLAKMIFKVLRNKNFVADTSNRFFIEDDIKLAIKKRFDLPAYSGALKPGIYTSFDEFKNNEPSITGIQSIYEEGKLRSLKNTANEKIDMKNYWGFCDGNKRYIFFRNEFTELIPCDRGFKVLSYRTKADMRGKTNFGDAATKHGILPSALLKMGDAVKIPEYFDLNLDTGNLFLEEIFGESSIGNMKSEILN